MAAQWTTGGGGKVKNGAGEASEGSCDGIIPLFEVLPVHLLLAEGA